jgi:hypothetical protein
MEVKGKRPRGRPRSRWEQRFRKYVARKKGRLWEEIEKKEEDLGGDRWMERLGFQTTFIGN